MSEFINTKLKFRLFSPAFLPTGPKLKYMILVHKDTSEYGVRFFGKEYGVLIMDWLKQNYRTVKVFGKEPLQKEKGGILIAIKKNKFEDAK